MKNSLNISDKLNLLAGSSKDFVEKAVLMGEVLIRIGDREYRHKNEISDDLLEYLAQCLETPEEGFLRPGSLFSSAQVPLGGAEDENDGIVYQDDSGDYRTMATATIAQANTYGRRWRGTINLEEPSPSPSPSGSPSPGPPEFSITRLELGRNFSSLDSSAFAYLFAHRDTDTETELDPGQQLSFPYEVFAGDSVIVEWEIYLVIP